MSKLLVTGVSNSGKTTLLKKLKDVFVVSRDGKQFNLELPHYNVSDFDNIDDMLEEFSQKLDAYKDKFKKEPKVIAFDSVSRIFTDIETNCNRKYKGYDVWTNVNKEINYFVETLNELERMGYSLVLIAHCVWDEKTGKYIETSKGSFARIGGFLGTVDYAVNIDIIGKNRIVTLKGHNLSRTLLDNIPDRCDANDFNLQDYLDKIDSRSNTVTQKWSI